MTKPDPRLSIKGLKTFIGNEGEGFNFTLYIDGKKAAFVINDASGGCNDYQWDRSWPEAEKLWNAIVKASPPVPADPKAGYPEMEMSSDMLAEELVYQAKVEKQERTWCKTKVSFRLKGDKEGAWRQMKGPYDVAAKSYLQTKYGDTIKEIMNDRYS